jgi:hypothetical protein
MALDTTDASAPGPSFHPLQHTPASRCLNICLSLAFLEPSFYLNAPFYALGSFRSFPTIPGTLSSKRQGSMLLCPLAPGKPSLMHSEGPLHCVSSHIDRPLLQTQFHIDTERVTVKGRSTHPITELEPTSKQRPVSRSYTLSSHASLLSPGPAYSCILRTLSPCRSPPHPLSALPFWGSPHPPPHLVLSIPHRQRQNDHFFSV